MSDYETQRKQLEEQLLKCKEEAQKQYKERQTNVQLKPMNQIGLNNTYETEYQDVIIYKPDIDHLLKQHEDSRKELMYHKERLEHKCRDILTTLESTVWRRLRWNSGTQVAFWDTENNYIWIIDTENVSNGAYKPDNSRHMDTIIRESGIQTHHYVFDFVSQPNGYMFHA